MTTSEKKSHSLILEANKYYFYCCAGLGDTLITLSLYEELKEKYGAEIIFLLKSTHLHIAKMYDIPSYIELKNKKDIKKIESTLSKVPAKGAVYAAHPCLHKELLDFFRPIKDQNSVQRFLPWFYEFFGLEYRRGFKAPLHYPKMSEQLKEKLETIAPIDKIVLLSPEATSMVGISHRFWEDLIEDIKKRGLCPVSNVIKSRNTLKGSKYIPLSSDEAFILGCYAKEVHSVRSGLCDLLYERGADLYVYYPTHAAYFLYGMNEMFARTDINEKIILA